jgi:flagellar FliL protein
MAAAKETHDKPERDKDEAAPAPAKKAKKKGGLVKVLAIAVVAVAGLGGGAWWFVAHPSAASTPPAPKLAERGLVTFEPFVVNLADTGGSHFLRVTLQLVVATPEAADHIQKTPVLVMAARSAILELLAQQTGDALVTPAGKQSLKHAIAEHATAALGDEKVIDVLFSEFVVQF